MKSRTCEVCQAPARRDYYEVLGLQPRAAGIEITRAYWRLAREYHALASSDPQASELLDELNQAAAALSAPTVRHDALDQAGAAAGRSVEATDQSAPTSESPSMTAVRGVTMVKRLGLLSVILAAVALTSTAAVPSYRAAVLPEVSVSSAPIIFLGDSITHGAGASSADATFVQLLRQRLEGAGLAKQPRDYDSVISALGGQVVDLRFSQSIGRQPRSLIVVEVGAHSVIEDAGLSSQQFGLGYGLMLDCLEGTGAAVVVSTVPWLGWDPSDPAYARAAERSTIISAEAASRGVAVADIWNAMKDRRDLLADDGLHPDDRGHRLIADLLWQKIAPVLYGPRRAFHDRCGYDNVLELRASEADAAVRLRPGG